MEYFSWDEKGIMDRKQIEKIIDEKKAESIKETKKNRLFFRILSGVLLAVCAGMIGFGIDFLVHADKTTGALILTAGILLLGAIITIKVFTEKKMHALIKNIEISSAYVRDSLSQSHLGFSAGSYQDMTRVATVDPDIWTDLFLSNSSALDAVLTRLIDRLAGYRDAIRSGDDDTLRTLLAEGRAAKDSAK